MERKKNKLINQIKSILLKPEFYITLITLLFLFLLFKKIIDNNFFERFFFELKGPYTYDTSIYEAVGKAMSQGYKPYADAFETKPPMIFYFAELSYILTHDYYLLNVISFSLLVLVLIYSLTYIIMITLKNKKNNIISLILIILFTLASSLLLLSYCELRSGYIQVELFGSSFIIFYFITIKLYDSSKCKLYSPLVILSSFLLMVGVMFKEPFVIIGIGGGLIISRTYKDLLYKVLLPLIYGGLFGIFLMSITGVIGPYLTIYLPHMLNSHISIYGSPIDRMLNIQKILLDLNYYSPFINVIVISSVLLMIIYRYIKKPLSNVAALNILYNLITTLIIIYGASFAVGLGGQYYNHHYIFTFPIYVLALIESIEFLLKVLDKFNEANINIDNNLIISSIMMVITITSIYGMKYLPKFEDDTNVLTEVQKMKKDAKYVDEIMDIMNEERYQYFGFNGPVFYSYTTHTPLGPCFFQDPNNYKEENYFTESLKKQLNEANIIIYRNINCGIIQDYIVDYIQTNFTLSVPDKKILELEKPDTFNYLIYYRK